MMEDTLSLNSSSSQQTQSSVQQQQKSGEAQAGAANNLVLVRIGVPELNVEKCLQYQKDEVIWEVKQQALAALPKELEESFNYGLFLPPSNGKAGKFLDEERRLCEYPFPGPIGYLELKYKRRVYKMLHMDEKQLKAINSKASRKKFTDNVTNNNVDKVNKMCAKGIDPNFHCQDSHVGETPLSLAVGIKAHSSKMLMTLINGGAIVDFRSKVDGSTAIHRAVTKNNIEALQTLLDLGASPNFKDLKGLTPLYHCVTNCSDVVCCELLLHDRAMVGATDLQGWQEVHQACRNGLVAHLEQLLYYGAELNARNASGNTPLHVCAVNNQDSCARTLLFRGADKNALNFAGQTPYQVAVIAGNLDLADVIQRHKMDDVVPFKEAPKFNPRRRTSSVTTTTFSSPRLQAPLQPTVLHSQQPQNSRLDSSPRPPPAPSSPSPSDRSLPPFSSGSSISETTSTGSGSSSMVAPPSQGLNGHNNFGSKSKASLLHQSLHNSLVIHEDEQLDSASALAVSLANDSLVESESLSSGVGTSSHSGSAGSSTTPTESHPPSLILPGMHVVCLENFAGHEANQQQNGLHISQGDIIEVTSVEDNSGMLEGLLRGKKGWFPGHCVQEVRLRNPHSVKQAISAAPRGDHNQRLDNANLSAAKHFATAQRTKDSSTYVIGEPRSAVLHKGKKGFGFVLRGAKAASPLMDMVPSEKCPGLQYMDDVDPGGVADMAGIRKGDFLLEINAHDVRQASHETVVSLIRKSGDLVKLTVVTVAYEPQPLLIAPTTPPMNNGNNGVSQQRGYSTLPRKLHGNSNRASIQPPPPPKRDPSTTLSVGRARARSMVANMAALEALDKAINEHDSSTSESVTGSVDSVQRMPDLVVETTREENNNKGKVYASVSEMKRMKLQASMKSKSAEDNKNNPASQDSPALRKSFSSTPDLKTSQLVPLISVEELKSAANNLAKNRKAKTDLDLNHYVMHDDGKVGDQRGYFTLPGRRNVKKLPPPEHSPPPPPPPPPPPTTSSEMMVVKSPEKTSSKTSSPIMSSFKPDDTGLVSLQQQQPESLPLQQLHHPPLQPPEVNNSKQRSPPARANSMPPRASRPQVLKKITVGDKNETYSVNGVNYTTYTTFRSPLTPEDINELEQPPMIPEPDYEEPIAVHSKTLERKKKKSVSFLEDISKKEESSVKRINNIGSGGGGNGNKKPESILKEPTHCQHGKPILRKEQPQQQPPMMPQPVLSSDKYMQPIERIPRLRTDNLPNNSASTTKTTVVKVLPEDKIRIEISNKNLQKSQSFNAKKAENGKMSVTSISESDILNARSALKPSRSFPNELNDNDNSSSGVSSDQEKNNGTTSSTMTTTTKFVTYLPVESSTPITKKAYDSESSESSGFDSKDHQAEQKIVSMKKMLHPKLQAIFDLPPNQSYSSQTLPNKSKVKKMTAAVASASAMANSERSISESLALINQHVTSLGEVNSHLQVEPVIGVLAPPPGFSDPESYSDNESLSSNGSKGFGKAFSKNKASKKEVQQHWSMTRSMEGFLDQSVQGLINANDVMSKSMDAAGFYGTMSKKAMQNQQQKGFRSKPLMGWTTNDVCDWLDSLFLPEYKPAFIQAEVDGLKLAGLTKSELESLGVIRVGHMLNIERSLKRYLEVTF